MAECVTQLENKGSIIQINHKWLISKSKSMIKGQSQIAIIHPLWIKAIQKEIGVLVF